MPRPKKPINDQILKEWLTSSFKNKHTRNVYTSGLRNFKQALNINDLGEYLQSNPDVNMDITAFLDSLENRPPYTISSYVSAVKVFLEDHDNPISSKLWNKLRRRGFYPRRVRAQTRDKIPTKEELKKIIGYSADIKAQALFLFLASSGARIGETLQLELSDFDLENDPPKVFITGEITKKGVGERTVYMSYEARDAIKNWLAVKNETMRRDGKGTYESPLMFPFSHATALIMWNNACDKAKLDKIDSRTGRQLYHIHSLRKYFRSNIGLDVDVTHSLMGHSGYLDEAYLRLNQNKIAKAYKKNVEKVSIHAVEDLELRKEVQSFKQNEKQKDKKIQELESQLKYFKSKQFTKDLIAKITDNAGSPLTPIQNVKTHKVKIKLDDGKKLAELMREGYNPTYSDDEIWILEKEQEQ